MKIIEIDPEDPHYPRCAKCDTPVEKFCVTDTGDALTLVTTCHGNTETVILSDEVWDDVVIPYVSIGPAFTGDVE